MASGFGVRTLGTYEIVTTRCPLVRAVATIAGLELDDSTPVLET